MTKRKSIFKILAIIAVAGYFLYYSIYSYLYTNYNKAYTIILIIAMIALIVVFCIKFKNQEEKSIFQFLETKRGELLTIGIVLAVAIIIRLIMFGVVPNGLMLDEYAMLYDAWCLATTGADRFGNTLPVYLVSWGSGQSSLMAFLTIPFVALFGMNEYTARIVSLIFSIITLFSFYFLMRRIATKKVALISLILFAFTPWHFMISRWGLDCNLLPALLILGILFLVKSLQGNRWWFLLSGFFFGISLYSYAISYAFLPVFLLVVYIYLIVKKRIYWPSFIVGNLILFCFALPLIFFLCVNYLGMPEFKIFGIFTVPKLSSLRSYAQDINIWNNIQAFFNLFLNQNDWLIWHCIVPFGVIFPILIPFLVLGIIHFIKAVNNKTITDPEMLIWIWAITATVVAICLLANSVNHINYLWPVVLILSGYGVADFCKNSKKCAISLACIFTIVVVMFNACYFSKEHSDLSDVAYCGGSAEAIEFAEIIRSSDQVIKTDVNYTIILVTMQVSPSEFNSTIVWVDPYGGIRSPISFSHYLFAWDDNDNQDAIYVLSNETEFNETGEWEKKTFDHYTVYYQIG